MPYRVSNENCRAATSCGNIYTAPAPAEARRDKYDETAVAMIALLRYGMGLPLNRLEKLRRHFGVPLPAWTQWQVVSERIDVVRRIYDKLAELAAAGSVVHPRKRTRPPRCSSPSHVALARCRMHGAVAVRARR